MPQVEFIDPSGVQQPVSNLRRLPVDIGSATVNLNGDVVAEFDGVEEALGAPADAAAGSDGATSGLIGLVKRLLGKLPALNNGNVPVLTTASATDANGNGTRQYDWANGLRQAVTGTSSAATALPTLGTSREVMFHASSRCFVRMGDSNVAAAAAAAGHMVLEAGERFHIRIATGVTHFRVIRDSADGNLNVTAVL